MNMYDEIETIAVFARIELTEAEKQKFAVQLKDILGYFEMIQEVDTTGVEPTSHPLSLVNVMRDDIVFPSLAIAEALSNAPQKIDNYIGVPRILE